MNRLTITLTDTKETDMTLTPAYGRDYKNKAAVLGDLNTGKDFITQPSGRYANGEDLKQEGEVNVRYAKLRKVLVARYTKGVWV